MMPALPLQPTPSSSVPSLLIPTAAASDPPTPSPSTPSFGPSPGIPLPSLDYSRPVSELLRTGTKRAHEEVEHSPGAARLAKAELSREEYARWCVALWCVYDALESALEENSFNPVLAPTYHPALLARAPPLAADIASLLSTTSTSWRTHPAASSLLQDPPKPLKAYVGRLTQLAHEAPERLLAHSYVRYLGDLSGGQIIRRRLAKSLSLSSPSSASSADGESDRALPGLSFFSFPRLSGNGVADQPEMRKIKDWFRTGMDEGVGGDEELKRAMVEEANEAFRLNAGLFGMLDEVWAASPGAKVVVEEKVEEVYTPLAKRTAAATNGNGVHTAEKEEEKAREGGFTLTSFVSFLIAVGLAHFLLVTLGFTGQRGWEKLEVASQWVRSKLEL